MNSRKVLSRRLDTLGWGTDDDRLLSMLQQQVDNDALRQWCSRAFSRHPGPGRRGTTGGGVNPQSHDCMRDQR